MKKYFFVKIAITIIYQCTYTYRSHVLETLTVEKRFPMVQIFSIRIDKLRILKLS